MGSPHRTTVLVVDDHADNVKAVTEMLRDAGYRCVVVRSGDRALQRAERVQPDVVLLDARMPGRNGFDVCSEFTTSEALSKIPVIFMTALTDDASKARAFDIGAVDYISKPVARGELLARVGTHIEIARYRDNLESEVARRTREIEVLNWERVLLLDTMDAHVWYLTDPGTYGGANRAHADFLCCTQAELAGAVLEEFLPEETAALCRETNRCAFSSTDTVHSEEWVVGSDGEKRLLSIAKTPQLGASGAVERVVCVGVDITEEQVLRDRLKREAQVNETLLSELHHRVKNNLTVIYSLLNLQATALDGGADPRDALRTASERVFAIAKAHEHMYQHGLVEGVPMKRYVADILFQLEEILGTRDAVSIETDIDDETLDAKEGIPVGLILNELATNALKHAFPPGRTGVLRVSIRIDERGQFLMTVDDDGIGFNVHAGSDGRTLGRQLVSALCEQLGATITVSSSADGTAVQIVVPPQ